MDDAHYLFKQDSAEKKRVAASASKRVGNTKKCTMPYEMLSSKERKKYMEASEVSVFKLRPMTMKEFKEVSGDKKIELLKWYGEKYGWNGAGVAAALGVHYTTGLSILEDYGLTAMFKARMKEATKEQKRQFMDNRKELEESRLIEAQQANPPEGTSPPLNEKKAAQSHPEPNNAVSGLVITAIHTGKDGETLWRQLSGIANAIDLRGRYDVAISIREVTE